MRDVRMAESVRSEGEGGGVAPTLASSSLGTQEET